MSTSIADLFRRSPDIDDFRAGVTGLKGDFSFLLDDMIALGNVYFELFPDCFSNRSCVQVALGYRMVRVCVIEKLVHVLPERLRPVFRDMLYDLNLVEGAVNSMVAGSGYEDIYGHLEKIERELALIQAEIDRIPVGMTKERFIGGISYLYNMLYVIKNAIGKHKPA